MLIIIEVSIDVTQNYVTWTNASEPLQFLVDDVEGLRKANVQFNISQPLPSYNESYSVVLMDRYLQPQVSSTQYIFHVTFKLPCYTLKMHSFRM